MTSALLLDSCRVVKMCDGQLNVSPDEHVTLLTRLLSDPLLRQRFNESPAEVVRELTDSPAAKSFLLTLDVRQLDAQARILIAKRRHEVAQLLPLTWQRLAESATEQFEVFASEAAWPEGHERHLIDAAAFSEWLARQRKAQVVVAEKNRIQFLLSGRRLTIRILTNDSLRPAIQILFRNSGGQVREMILGFGSKLTT